LPQLFNVLRGDMSIIGPRPLLPVDLAQSAELRASVVPGLTGWAQVHGGKLITASEKNALDEWYVRNASIRLDIKIFAKTLVTILRGDRRAEGVLLRAKTASDGQS
jgi:lipopolysaccharide/colanic/teichoic acid biosynthesis glycosyltransferase